MAEPYAPLLTRKTTLGGTQETTSGTAATITAPFSATTCYDIKMESEDFFAGGERKPDGNYIGNVDSVTGQQMGKLTWKQDLRNADTFVALLTGCGFKLDTGVYGISSDMSTRKTWSFAVWEDGRRKGLKGASGTFKIVGKAGQRVTIEWTWRGIWIAPIAEAMPAQAPIQTVSYFASSVTCTLGGAAIPMTEMFEIDGGAVVSDREHFVSASGVLHTLIAEMKPMIKLDPEARKVGDLDTYGLLLAGTTAAFNLVLTTGATTLTIAAPRVQRVQVNGQDRKGKRIDALQLQCNISSGDDALTFTQV